MLRYALPRRVQAAAIVLMGVALAAPAVAQTYKAPSIDAPAPPAPPSPPVAAAPPAPPAAAGRHRIVVVDGERMDEEGWSERDQAKFDAKMRELDGKMARLSERLKAEDAARSERIKAIVAAATARAYEASERAMRHAMSPDRAREIADRARRQAEQARLSSEQIRAVAEHAAAQAEAAARTLERIQPQLDQLSRELEHMKWDEDGDRDH